MIFESGGFGIINKFSTQGYLKALNQINRNISYELLEGDRFRVAYNSREPIDLYFYNRYVGQINKKSAVEPVAPRVVLEPKKGFWKRLFNK